jgi:hypothetical protein
MHWESRDRDITARARIRHAYFGGGRHSEAFFLHIVLVSKVCKAVRGEEWFKTGEDPAFE